MGKVLHVHIGEVKVARNGEQLTAILGSCVGIGVIWRRRKICGLAHCLLPETPTPTFNIGGRFVDQAIRSLLAMMKIHADDTAEIDVIIVGGGNMTSPEIADQSTLVGSHNFKVAIREAKNSGLRIVYSDGGGDEGRKIFIDASDYSFRVEKIPRIVKVA